MRANDIQAQIPGLMEARAREQLNRAMAFAGLTWNLCGQECVQLTPRHRLELQLGRNAYAVGLTPMKGDAFCLLWRLNPAFSRSLLKPRAALAHWRLKRAIRRTDEERTHLEIYAFLAAMLQDLPESRSGAEENPGHPERYLHWMATESLFFKTECNTSFADYMARTGRSSSTIRIASLRRGFAPSRRRGKARRDHRPITKLEEAAGVDLGYRRRALRRHLCFLLIGAPHLEGG